MVFSGLIFLFVFLPLVLLVTFALPAKFRNGFLFLANLIFYAWGEPIFVFIMIASVIINYGVGRAMEKFSGKIKLIMALGIVADLALLFFFKYAGFVREILTSLTGLTFGHFPEIALPIGISFYTFQAVSYLIDVYRGTVKAERSFIDFGMYLSFFPQLIAGPIVRYEEMAADLKKRAVTLPMFGEGVRLFLIGLGKKVLIANEMGVLWETLRPLAATEGLLCAYVGIIAYAFQIYFDFSGYSDMARGLGRMFGFRLPVNFNYPYSAVGVTDFWRRWHMTLTQWFRDYIYIPMGGNRCGIGRNIFNIFVIWALTGLWHGADYNFLLWGIYWFVLLTAEKFVLRKPLAKLPGALKHLYTGFFILMGWVLFAITDMTEVGSYYQALFSLKNGFCGGDSLSYIISYLPLLAVAFIASQRFGKNLWERLQNPKLKGVLEIGGLALLFFLAVASLVNGSYNPFLYFRF